MIPIGTAKVVMDAVGYRYAEILTEYFADKCTDKRGPTIRRAQCQCDACVTLCTLAVYPSHSYKVRRLLEQVGGTIIERHAGDDLRGLTRDELIEKWQWTGGEFTNAHTVGVQAEMDAHRAVIAEMQRRYRDPKREAAADEGNGGRDNYYM